MKYTSVIKSAFLTALVAIAVELLLSLPSHPECGTSSIDFIPCGYIDRIGWNLTNGSWGLDIVLAVILIALVWSTRKFFLKNLKKS